MKKCTLALSALLLCAGSAAVYSQTPTGNESANCADPLSSLSGDCAQSQGQDQQQLQQTRTGTGAATTEEVRPNAPSTSSPYESEPYRAGNYSRFQQQQTQQNLPPEPPTEFQKFVAATTGQVLQIYGANLFRNVPSTFSPNDLAPVSSGYVIGPDDELRVRIWGQINYTGNLRVDRSGSIYLPQVGSLQVAGLQFSDLDHRLRVAVGRIYRNFDLSVDMGRIRSIQVYVTGQARRPGVYTVSSLSSLVDALFASGGPSPQGSLRHILLNRDGKTVTDLDLYALLIHGDKSKDAQLLPGDVIYIPAVGSQAAITGSVRNPGIFELRTGETTGDLIRAAGETTAVASNARISLDRVENHQLRQATEFSFDIAGLSVPLLDGDIMRIDPIIPAYQKTVTLRGNVANPGRFGWRSGMHLSDLIPNRDSLVSRDYWWKRSHLGLPGPEFEPTISTLGRDPRSPETNTQGFTQSVSQESLTAALTPSDQSNEQSYDQFNQQLNNQRTGTETGPHAGGSGALALENPQAQSGQSGQSRLNAVRSLTPAIDWDYAVIERLDPDTLKTSLIPFDLGKLVLNHDAAHDLALQPGDTVTIFSQADIRVPLEHQIKYVVLEGEFIHSGIYSVQPGETLRDLVRRAGGLSQKAYLYGSSFTRESTRVLQQQRLNEYVRSVSMEAARGTQALAVTGTSGSGSGSDVAASQAVSQDLVSRLSQIRATGRIVLQFRSNSTGIDAVPEISLENGDHFTVPSIPATVNVVGAVYGQDSYIFRPGKAVGYYLHLAGGANRNADSRHSFVIRADGSIVSRQAVKNQWSYLGEDTFLQLRVNAGDTVVVPDKTLRPSALRGVMDWTQVFSQLALGAASVNVIK